MTTASPLLTRTSIAFMLFFLSAFTLIYLRYAPALWRERLGKAVQVFSLAGYPHGNPRLGHFPAAC